MHASTVNVLYTVYKFVTNEDNHVLHLQKMKAHVIWLTLIN